MRITIDKLSSILNITNDELIRLYPDIHDQIQYIKIINVLMYTALISILIFMGYSYIVHKRYANFRIKYQLNHSADFKYAMPIRLIDSVDDLRNIKYQANQYQFKIQLVLKGIILLMITALGLEVLKAYGAPGVVFILNL